MQVHDGTAFWKSFVGVEQIKWPIRRCVQFPDYVLYPGFPFCGKMEVVRSRPIESAAVFFQTRILKTRTPCVKNTCKSAAVFFQTRILKTRTPCVKNTCKLV